MYRRAAGVLAVAKGAAECHPWGTQWHLVGGDSLQHIVLGARVQFYDPRQKVVQSNPCPNKINPNAKP